jgi:hypothetical protein
VTATGGVVTATADFGPDVGSPMVYRLTIIEVSGTLLVDDLLV